MRVIPSSGGSQASKQKLAVQSRKKEEEAFVLRIAFRRPIKWKEKGREEKRREGKE